MLTCFLFTSLLSLSFLIYCIKRFSRLKNLHAYSLNNYIFFFCGHILLGFHITLFRIVNFETATLGFGVFVSLYTGMW